MSKTLFMDPKKLDQKGSIKFKDIPMNTYGKTLKEERSTFSDEQLLTIYEDIAVIREF